jgi:TPR repeat protein
MELAVRYYRKAMSQSDRTGMHNFARCLEYGKGIGQDFICAATYYCLSAELGNAAAEISFGIYLEQGIGVQLNAALVTHYYQRLTLQSHPDGQIILASATNTAEVSSRTSNLRPNITNLWPITDI